MRGYRVSTSCKRSGAKGQVPVPGKKWAGSQGTKPGQGAPSAGASLPEQGWVRGFGSGQLAPSQSFLPILQRTSSRKRGCLGGRATLGKGSPLHRIQTLLGRKMLPGALEGTQKHGVLGSLPNPKFANSGECCGGRAGGRETYGKTSVFHIAGRGSRPSTACCPISFLFPPVPSRDNDWSLYGLALSGLRQWALGSPEPPPLGSHSV